MRHIISCLLLVLAMLVQPFAQAAIQLTDNPLNQADFPDYRVGSGGGLYLVWHDAVVDNGNGAILFKLFGAAGTELITDIQINDSSGSRNTHPVTAIDASNRLFVVWQNLADQEIYFLRLEPLLDDLDPATPADLAVIKTTGVGSDVRISAANDGWPASNPAMAIDGGGFLHIVWESGVGGPVQYVKVDADGIWQQVNTLDVSTPGGTAGSGNDLPDIAIDSAGHAHVVYTQADEVYYAMIDGTTGAVRIAPTLLTVDDGLPAGNATVSVDLADNRVYVVYKQATTLVGNGDEQVYLTALDPALHVQPASWRTSLSSACMKHDYLTPRRIPGGCFHASAPTGASMPSTWISTTRTARRQLHNTTPT